MSDPKTGETVAGEVVGVEAFTPLGPAWYIDNQEFKIEVKDKIEVKGSRVSFDGKPAIIAAEVKKGDQVLKLRDENGVPVWAGWRKR